ncbi:membrane hypothetical protein [Candidatus Sulfotelmatomonas gaucii]|uniref:Uncharacterized protein n=1 Tax=Candidatus Sulfuritelmatomonas gaucii TaxID=2043161 RepID=A0A2N9M2E4_9BACT|nr:membrane hypothetical protein [Candidatus Sulfotelmatomonas gaucii]
MAEGSEHEFGLPVDGFLDGLGVLFQTPFRITVRFDLRFVALFVARVFRAVFGGGVLLGVAGVFVGLSVARFAVVGFAGIFVFAAVFADFFFVLVVTVFVLFITGIVLVADVSARAAAALIALADAELWGKVVPFFRLGHGFYRLHGELNVMVLGVLGGDLHGVEEAAAELGVDATAEKAVGDLRDGELDGGGIFGDGEPDAVEPWSAIAGQVMDFGVEVAEGVAAQGRGLAAEPVGLDVSTCHVHFRAIIDLTRP